MDPLEKVVLDGPKKFAYANSLLSYDEKERLRLALLSNIDVFALSHSYMAGINPTVASHKLNIISTAIPVKQRVRRFHSDCHQIINEIENLLTVGFIKEVKCPEWLANVVVVSKKGCKWRVCIDYTNLKEACLKDSFPYPRIDQIFDSATRHRILSFLDTFSRYHQIPMHPPNVEKTAFITPHGLYYYNVMPFGLKNVGATYQRLVRKIFQSLLSNTMEAYIDDMLVKSRERFDHIQHLQEAFELLQRYGMKLNPLKCAFRVSSRKFLGFMVTQRGIDATQPRSHSRLSNRVPRRAPQRTSLKLNSSSKAKPRSEPILIILLNLSFLTLL